MVSTAGLARTSARHISTHRRGTAPDEPGGRAFARRTVLAGAVGIPLGGALGWPFRIGARAETLASPAPEGFDPALAARLQQALDRIVVASNGSIPGVLLHVEVTGRGRWAGAAGLAQFDPDVAMRPGDRVGVGSIVKPFVAATVLQLVEDGRFGLDAALPDVLPTDVTERFPHAPHITVRMLLGHRSGLPDWNSPEVEAEAARDPGRVWQASEFLDLAAAQEQTFPPGTDYAYSNTNYTLLGLVVERATGRSWRDEVTDRVVEPLGLAASALPAPGDRSLGGPHAHGYAEADGKLLDITTVDPSMAGTAGGNSLVTSAGDLVGFLDGLLAGKLFRRPETLQAMLDFKPASGCPTCEPGQVGYGLGLLRRVLPGGIETVDHLGGAAGYRAYAARLQGQQVTLAVAMNSMADPSLLVFPVLAAFGAEVPATS
jgi:D-alanyl-D-alanine carboxypeptidase